MKEVCFCMVQWFYTKEMQCYTSTARLLQGFPIKNKPVGFERITSKRADCLLWEEAKAKEKMSLYYGEKAPSVFSHIVTMCYSFPHEPLRVCWWQMSGHLSNTGALTFPGLTFLTLMGRWDVRGSSACNESPTLSSVTLKEETPVCQGTNSECTAWLTAFPTWCFLGLPCTCGDWQAMLLIVWIS